MLKLKEFPIIRRTDRDMEIPVLVDFLERFNGKYQSVIDVGAHYTAGYYADEIRKRAKKYHALDPGFDFAVAKIADRFIEADAVHYDFAKYDMVVCCSTIEHVGQYPYRYKDDLKMRKILFKKMLNSAQKYFWISFPVGLEYIDDGEMRIITKEELESWEELIKPYKYEIGFYFSGGPQAGHPWLPNSREKCLNTPYNVRLGTQSLCVIELQK
jgi:hypothetical protein